MQNKSILKKAFLATKSVAPGYFLLTEKVEEKSNESFLLFIIESHDDKFGKKFQQITHQHVTKEFLSNNNYSLLNFEESLNNVNKYFLNNQTAEQQSSLNAFIGFYQDFTLHISMIGSIEGYLLRKGKINSLTEGLSSNNDTSFVNITSGELLALDSIIVGNKNFFDRLSLDRIRRTIDHLSPKEATRDFFRILRKNHFLDCNSIILNVSPYGNDNNASDIDDIDEIIYLDEKEETKLSHTWKTIKPFLIKFLSYLATAINRSGKLLLQLWRKISQSWDTKYRQKTKEFINETGKNTKKGLNSVSSNIRQGIKPKSSKVKIKSYQGAEKNYFLYIKNIINFIIVSLIKLFKKENRKYLYTFLLLVLILTSYLKIVSNNKNRDSIKQQNDAKYALEQAEASLQKANEDISLGRSNGMETLSQALDYLSQAENNPATLESAQKIKKDIYSKIDGITNTIRLSNPSAIFSFNHAVSVTAISGSVIYGITEDGKIYFTDARDKDPRLISAIDSTFGKPLSASYSENTGLLYILTDKPTIWAFDPLAQSGAEIEVTESSWEAGNAITTYSTNLYLLDSVNGKIWRHSKNGQKFNKGVSYAGNSNAALNGVSLAIDGSIYVLKEDSTIVKFSHGTSDTNFSLQNPPQPDSKISKAESIITDSDSQNIYILDSDQNRILEFAKDGKFVKQYRLEGKDISSFQINPRVQKMWVFCQNEVFEIDL